MRTTEVAISSGDPGVTGTPRSAPPIPTIEGIMQLERAWLQALVKADIGVLDEIWADDYSLTTPDGTRLTRADCIAGLGDGAITFESFDAEALDARNYGDDVVVRGCARVKCRLDLHDLDAAERYVTFYSRRGDRWQQVATVVTRALPEQTSDRVRVPGCRTRRKEFETRSYLING
jgi:hypothetical protein